MPNTTSRARIVMLTRNDRRRNAKLARLVRSCDPSWRSWASTWPARSRLRWSLITTRSPLGRKMFDGEQWVIDDILGLRGADCRRRWLRWDRGRMGAERASLEAGVGPLPGPRHRGGVREADARAPRPRREGLHPGPFGLQGLHDHRPPGRGPALLHPYALEGDWCRLRHLGARCNDQFVEATAARQQLRDLLECVWPAVLEAAAQPPKSTTLRAAMAACPATRPRSARWAGTASPPPSPPNWSAGAIRRNLRILRAIWACAHQPGGLERERHAAVERAGECNR